MNREAARFVAGAGVVVGCLFIAVAKEVRPFTDKQIELVTNFAAQPVIACRPQRRGGFCDYLDPNRSSNC
jgi:hypothetical protein